MVSCARQLVRRTALRLAPLSKLPAPLVFVAPAKMSTSPVVADASMSVSEDAIFVGDVAVAAMSVTIPSPVCYCQKKNRE